MKAGNEPQCLTDAWITAMLESKAYEDAVARGETPANKPMLIREYSDYEIAMVLMSFLFASQDAMTSGLIYAFQHMADYPAIAAKVRAEQLEVRGGDLDGPLTLEMMDDMPYLRAFVKETLRLRRESTVNVSRRLAKSTPPAWRSCRQSRRTH